MNTLVTGRCFRQRLQTLPLPWPPHRGIGRRWSGTAPQPEERFAFSRPSGLVDLSEFTADKIRNFCIVAHVDHGKSSLADRLLEQTGVIDRHRETRQVLDKLAVERARGITVKAQTASMVFRHAGSRYLLNLIDTPGHVDFSYEVSRSLSACEGALLLVDASQGIQAQTVANFYLAFGEGLAIVPVLNKVDLPGAEAAAVQQQLERTFELQPDAATGQMLRVSAKTGLNVDHVLPLVVERVPPPAGVRDAPLKALLFDSWYDTYLGVVALLAIKDGQLRAGDRLESATTGFRCEVAEVGIMHPHATPCAALLAGQVGYAVMGMKNPRDARVGDTFFRVAHPVAPLPGFRPAKPMVFSGVYPTDASGFPRLKDALERLLLNDASVTMQRETSNALGQGFRLGFLGTLHMQVVSQRLCEEHGMDVLISQPTVPYQIVYESGEMETVDNPVQFPEGAALARVAEIREPVIRATLLAPAEQLGAVISLCSERRGSQMELTYPSDTQVMLRYSLPLAEVLTSFYDALKSRTRGYASFDYDDAGFAPSDMVRLNVAVNGCQVDALTSIVHRSNLQTAAKRMVARLAATLDQQLFEVVIQASVNNRVIARESLRALRKDVTAKLYGGDVTRRMKLLAKQREGKRRLQQESIGRVRIRPETFRALFAGSGSTQ